MASVTRERPFGDYSEFVNLKYGLVEQGIDIEYFHCSEDKQVVRDQVFKIIELNLTGMRIDAVIVDKKKTKPTLRDPARFYPRMLGYLLRYILEGQSLDEYGEVLVFTD
ncbi:MAG: hypothetical protein QOH71_731 [Blastocatellia bacterium]|nr:hypothetical protein [Blastocatellia bacterium]